MHKFLWWLLIFDKFLFMRFLLFEWRVCVWGPTSLVTKVAKWQEAQVILTVIILRNPCIQLSQLSSQLESFCCCLKIKNSWQSRQAAIDYKVQEIKLFHQIWRETFCICILQSYSKLSASTFWERKKHLHKFHFIISWGKTLPGSSPGGDVIQIRYTVA